MKCAKRVIYALIPAIVMFGGLEVVVRLLDLANPTLIVAPLPTELRGFSEPDQHLFWRMRPGAVVRELEGTTVMVNTDGFRGNELAPKTDNEYRILSLGESTTFGAGVEQEETYSYLLQQNLNLLDSTANFNVLNCGFSAYSSFQMLKYLELKGLQFEPDMVIVYSEVNDYLPSTLRNFGHDETTLTISDQQLYESASRSWSSYVIDHWMLAKFIMYRYAAHRTRKLSSKVLPNPLNGIGLNDSIPNRVAVRNDGQPISAGLREMNLGRRVNSEERENNLKALKSICDENDIELIVIHPSYRNSKEHECLLTETCNAEGITVFEAFSSLHSKEIAPDAMFLDSWHPSSLGHSRLARDLSIFIAQSQLAR